MSKGGPYFLFNDFFVRLLYFHRNTYKANPTSHTKFMQKNDKSVHRRLSL